MIKDRLEDLKVKFNEDRRFTIEKPEGFPYYEFVYRTPAKDNALTIGPLPTELIPMEITEILTVTGEWTWARDDLTFTHRLHFEIWNPYKPSIGYVKHDFSIDERDVLFTPTREIAEDYLTEQVRGVLDGTFR